MPPTPLDMLATGSPSSPSIRAPSPTVNNPGQMNGRPPPPAGSRETWLMSSCGRATPASGPCDARCDASRSASVMFEVCSPTASESFGPTSTMRIVTSGRASAIERAYAEPAGPLPTISTSTDSVSAARVILVPSLMIRRLLRRSADATSSTRSRGRCGRGRDRHPTPGLRARPTRCRRTRPRRARR